MSLLIIQDMFVPLFVAVFCGMVIGLEREFKHKPAGLRTTMLVSLGSCAFTLMMEYLPVSFAHAGDIVRIDPSRVVQGIITGIGFLGAGVIIQSQGHVKGMTTSASIWIASAIGIACGFRFYELALLVTLLTLVILFLIAQIERAMEDDRPDEGI